MYRLSRNTDYKQLLLILGSLIIEFVFIIIYMVGENKNYLYILIFSFLFLIIVNIIYSRIFDICLINNEIIIKNLYIKKKIVSANDFSEIQVINRFFFRLFIPHFYMSPPYFYLRLKNGEKFIFLDGSRKSIFSFFNPSKYAAKLTETFRNNLKKRE